jgi:precorrin-6A/cobalt-precorrin-6A reductase
MPGSERRHLLILGGTAEARALAAAATARLASRLRITTSLAGRTREVAALAGETRRGGFGGAAGLAAYLGAAPIDLVIDATHPFAVQISEAARTACRALRLPLLILARPAWAPQPGDRWIEVADAAAAARILPAIGRRAFLTIGRSALAAFAGLTDLYFLVRLVDPPEMALPLRGYDFILSRGPFTVAEERGIMARHAIDVLVTKASGGDATAAKLEAARRDAIPVVMLRRPAEESGDRVAGVADALSWLASRLDRLEEVSR